MSSVSTVAAHAIITAWLKQQFSAAPVAGRVLNWVPPNLTPEQLYPFIVYKFQSVDPAPDKWVVDSLEVSLLLNVYSKYEGDLEMLQILDIITGLNGTKIPVPGQSFTLDVLLYKGGQLADGADGVTRLGSFLLSFYITPIHSPPQSI